MIERVVLKLYVAGASPRSIQAIENIQRIHASLLVAVCDLLIIDVLEQPQQAADAKILATPTLVREVPLPQRRIIGDLSDLEKVLVALNLGGHAAANA